MRSIKLLVVDDDHAQRELVAGLLEAHGYQVDTASDGEQALRLMCDRNYSLAILDYQMPGMDGVELYRQARTLRPGLPGIFLTAFTTIDTVFPAIDAGIERVLAKPVNYHELIPLVEELAGKAG